MILIVGGQTVTTDEAGTNKLDATKLFGNLPSLDGGSLTNVGIGYLVIFKLEVKQLIKMIIIMLLHLILALFLVMLILVVPKNGILQ